MFIPVFKQHAENEEIKMVMVNIDDDAEAAGAAGVQGVPTIQIYKDGAKVEENVGFMTPDQLVEFINRVK
jgi:thioredoxin 1